MAVKVQSGEYHMLGLSSDELPPGAPEGATFHMVDTGECWIFHDGMWTEDLRVAQALREEI